LGIENYNSLNLEEVFEKKGFVTSNFEDLINWASRALFGYDIWISLLWRRDDAFLYEQI